MINWTNGSLRIELIDLDYFTSVRNKEFDGFKVIGNTVMIVYKKDITNKYVKIGVFVSEK